MLGKFKPGWKTQINLLWIGQVIILGMLAMSMPYWPLYIEKLGNFSPQQIRFWSAAIYVAPFVTSTFCSPMWGKLADKYGYKPMIIRACMGLFITQTLILLFPNVLLIFLFRLLQGILAGFIVAAQAWALTISPEGQQGATIGKLQSATAIGNLIGPLMGGFIATFVGYKAIFSSSSIICGTITLLFFLFLQDTRKVNQDHLSTEVSAQGRKLFSIFQQSVISILLVIVIIQLARQMVTPIFALFVTEKLGGNAITVGILYAATGLMIFITAPYWGKYFDKAIRQGYQVYSTVVWLLFICAFLQVFHAFANTVAEIFVLRLLWGICLGALLPVLLQLLVNNINNWEKGLFLGWGNSATKFGNLLGILIGALIEAYFGYEKSFLMTAILYFISGMVILLYLKPLNSVVKIEQ